MDRPTVVEQCEMAETAITEIESGGIKGNFLFLIIVNNRRFVKLSEDGVVNGQGFRSVSKSESLEFDSRQIVFSRTAFNHSGVVCY